MPLGITLARAEIMDWVPGSHASTFGVTCVCIEAALATMVVLESEAIRNAGSRRRPHDEATERSGKNYPMVEDAAVGR